VVGSKETTMLTRMSDADWAVVLKLFEASRSRRGDKGRNDRKFLEALHYFTLHNITWRALPAEFGNWNSVWKRFWRLSQSGVFEAFFETLAQMSETAHLVQMFDSTIVRAHVSAAGAKGGKKARRLGARAAASRQRSTSKRISMARRSASI
jgi:transposase